ncbi:MAG: D-hexose-6-phosphate mutarotase [Alphaproteobacteria bacterium]|nr:D-hexose-6-phosphate mutarotase [Alphaproteobacteria bacterium]MBP7760074.1 D-hexose-6-phosphate mutarotase [Alphaproteobacteria bacterium]MBP7763459.1 D-hexose-6-phosphate mutarotase [Alphaproteobacteria bacterium]MBP7905692.1 D-hexose-6-phosphate mutarotase [Alphaproteobacteria bacterium]
MENALTHTDTKQKYGSKDALPLLEIRSSDIYATIALLGAQILECSIRGKNLLWLSPKAKYESGKPVRGGIPLCAPWFGIHPDPAKPKHGFVRNRLWTLENISKSHNSITLLLSLTHGPDTIFPHAFRMEYSITIAQTLSLQMEIRNTGTDAMPFNWAFHSYHPVSDLSTASVTGLEDLTYLDATDNFARKTQIGPILFSAEVDRVYENVPENQTLNTAPAIEISASNCPSAIIWNPGPELAKGMDDVGEENYQGFVCVERGAVHGNTLTLPSDQSYTAKLKIE